MFCPGCLRGKARSAKSDPLPGFESPRTKPLTQKKDSVEEGKTSAEERRVQDLMTGSSVKTEAVHGRFMHIAPSREGKALQGIRESHHGNSQSMHVPKETSKELGLPVSKSDNLKEHWKDPTKVSPWIQSGESRRHWKVAADNSHAERFQPSLDPVRSFTNPQRDQVQAQVQAEAPSGLP